MNITPEQVAEYADKDSMAMSKVKFSDIIGELKIRATESNTLTKLDIIKTLRDLADEAEAVCTRGE